MNKNIFLFHPIKIYLCVVSVPPNMTANDQCDFDSGLCTFLNDPTQDQFDWTRKSGRTSSTNTCPTTDHTLETGSVKECLNQ